MKFSPGIAHYDTTVLTALSCLDLGHAPQTVGYAGYECCANHVRVSEEGVLGNALRLGPSDAHQVVSHLVRIRDIAMCARIHANNDSLVSSRANTARNKSTSDKQRCRIDSINKKVHVLDAIFTGEVWHV